MQITHFRAEGVHGYINFNIKLNSDLTFLHGINGQGKTTAIRAMVALMNFDLSWLARTRFKILELIAIESDGEKIKISASRKEDLLKFEVLGGGKKRKALELNVPPPEYIQRDSQNIKFDDDFLIRHGRSPLDEAHFELIRFFKQLKKPLYLGLDRTTLSLQPDESRIAIMDRRRELSSRPHLEASLIDAEELAREAYAEYQRNRELSASQIREKIPLILFQPADRASIQAAAFSPNKNEIKKLIVKYRSLRETILSSYVVIARDRIEIERVVARYFDSLISVKEKTLNIDFHSGKLTEAEISILIEANGLEAALPFIQQIGALLEDFQNKQVLSFGRFAEYISVVNDFISDSKKSIDFSPSGRLSVTLPNGEQGDVRHLSSGERQIVVLITHLAFKNLRGERDILLIDEPELSLHIAWQMQFVNAIQRVSPSTQMILATHSPSIILDREDKCVALTA